MVIGEQPEDESSGKLVEAKLSTDKGKRFSRYRYNYWSGRYNNWADAQRPLFRTFLTYAPAIVLTVPVVALVGFALNTLFPTSDDNGARSSGDKIIEDEGPVAGSAESEKYDSQVKQIEDQLSALESEDLSAVTAITVNVDDSELEFVIVYLPDSGPPSRDNIGEGTYSVVPAPAGLEFGSAIYGPEPARTAERERLVGAVIEAIRTFDGQHAGGENSDEEPVLVPAADGQSMSTGGQKSMPVRPPNGQPPSASTAPTAAPSGAVNLIGPDRKLFTVRT